MLPADYLDQLKVAYPKRDGGNGWGAVPRLVNQAIANGAVWERILAGVKNYAIHCKRKGMVGTEFVMQARTFLGRDWHFDEWADMDMRSASEIAADKAREHVMARAKQSGFRNQLPAEPDFRYEAALRDHERSIAPRAEPKFQVVK